jgi:hypothetical protein
VNWPFQIVQGIQEGGPCGFATGRRHDVTGEPRRDPFIFIDAVLLLSAVCANAHLKQAPNAEVQGTGSSASMRVGFTVKLTSQVGMRIDLHKGQAAKIALKGGMIPKGCEHGRENPVLSAKGQREHIAAAPRPQEGLDVVQLLEQ